MAFYNYKLICYIYIALLCILKALYIWKGESHQPPPMASTWMMRRQPYCARTPTTHQLTGGEETESILAIVNLFNVVTRGVFTSNTVI